MGTAVILIYKSACIPTNALMLSYNSERMYWERMAIHKILRHITLLYMY